MGFFDEIKTLSCRAIPALQSFLARRLGLSPEEIQRLLVDFDEEILPVISQFADELRHKEETQGRCPHEVQGSLDAQKEALRQMARPAAERTLVPFVVVFEGPQPAHFPRHLLEQIRQDGALSEDPVIRELQEARHCAPARDLRAMLEAGGYTIIASGSSTTGWHLDVECSFAQVEALARLVCSTAFLFLAEQGVTARLLFDGWGAASAHDFAYVCPHVVGDDGGVLEDRVRMIVRDQSGDLQVLCGAEGHSESEPPVLLCHACLPPSVLDGALGLLPGMCARRAAADAPWLVAKEEESEGKGEKDKQDRDAHQPDRTRH